MIHTPIQLHSSSKVVEDHHRVLLLERPNMSTFKVGFIHLSQSEQTSPIQKSCCFFHNRRDALTGREQTLFIGRYVFVTGLGSGGRLSPPPYTRKRHATSTFFGIYLPCALVTLEKFISALLVNQYSTLLPQ